MSLISSWLSTKTSNIVDNYDYRRYTILASIGTTLDKQIIFLLDNHIQGLKL